MNRKRLMFAIVLLGALLLMALPVQADGRIQPTLTADRESITVGDTVQLTLEVIHPANLQVIIPELEQNWGDFEVQDQSNTETVLNEDGTATTVQKITVTVFQPGTFETPSLPLIINGVNGQTSEVAPGPVAVSVGSVLTEGDPALQDIRPQVSMEVPLPWPLLVAGLLTAAAVAGGGWWLVRRWQRNGSRFVDNRPPYQVAIDELGRISGLRLPDSGQFKEHYSLVTDVLRNYLEQQHRVQATDRTTSELKQELAYTRIESEQARTLVNLLGDADFVKFAKLIPDRDEAYLFLDDARQFVEATRPQPETPGKGYSPKSINTTAPMEVSQ